LVRQETLLYFGDCLQPGCQGHASGDQARAGLGMQVPGYPVPVVGPEGLQDGPQPLLAGAANDSGSCDVTVHFSTRMVH
jgi:hypothetical protein